MTRVRTPQQLATRFCAAANCTREAEFDSDLCLSHAAVEADRRRGGLTRLGRSSPRQRPRQPVRRVRPPERPEAARIAPAASQPVYEAAAAELAQLAARLDALIADAADARQEIGELAASWKRLCYDLAIIEVLR